MHLELQIKDTSTLPINQGPAQNPQVAIYNDAMLKYPFSLSREPWSKADKENLKKGIKQQIQEMMLQNLFRYAIMILSYLELVNLHEGCQPCTYLTNIN